MPLILDAKWGDIAKSSNNYAAEAWECWRADGITVSPYRGHDSVFPLARAGKGVVMLDRTSNSGASDFQDRRVERNGLLIPLYEVAAHKIVEWSRESPNFGGVVGATAPDELENVLRIYAGSPAFALIPGVGGQGGEAPEVMARMQAVGFDMAHARINSSSGITHPWATTKEAAPRDFAKDCTAALADLIEQTRYRA